MPYTIEADLHVHTVASGHAFSTVKELIEYAAVMKHRMIGITDHGINMPGGPHLYYFYKLLELPRYINGVEILRGVEANIVDIYGNLDMPQLLLENLDVVLAGFHSGAGYESGSVEQNTKAMVAAINNPYVHIIVHPGNPEFPVDFEKIVYAANQASKVLEINNKSFQNARSGSGPRCLELAKIAARTNTYVAINSDAHSCFELGICNHAFEIAKIAGIKPSQILNSSVEMIREYLLNTKIKVKRIS
jgi:putative hydrolase